MTYKIQINDDVRDATDDEAAHIEAQQAEMAAADKARAEAIEAAEAAKASARAKLKALGLTDDEIAALIPW